MPWKSKRKRNAYMRRLCDRMKAALISALGGKCEKCGSTEDLSIEHKEGRTWKARKLSRHGRLKKYEAELKAGVKLAVRCLSCNSADGNYWSRFYEEKWVKEQIAAGNWPPKYPEPVVEEFNEDSRA